MKFKIEVEVEPPSGSKVKPNSSGMSVEDIAIDAFAAFVDGKTFAVYNDEDEKAERWTIKGVDDA
jgi:hypothetical protein